MVETVNTAQSQRPSSNFHSFVETAEDAFVLVKYLIVVMLVLLLLFNPAYLRGKLLDLGIQVLDFGIFKADLEHSNENVKAAALEVDAAQQKLLDIQSQLADIEKSNPSAGAQLGTLKTAIANLQSQTNTVDQSLKTTLLTQQEIIQRVAPQPTDSVGWVYAGQVDENKQKWAGVGARNVSSSLGPDFKPGQTVAVTNSTYLHNGPSSGGWHTEGDILTVLPANANVQIVDVNFSHAKAGGWFVWLKVRRM